MRSRVWYEMRNGAHNGGLTRLCNEHQMKLEMNKCIRGAACKETKKNKTPASTARIVQMECSNKFIRC